MHSVTSHDWSEDDCRIDYDSLGLVFDLSSLTKAVTSRIERNDLDSLVTIPLYLAAILERVIDFQI